MFHPQTYDLLVGNEAKGHNSIVPSVPDPRSCIGSLSALGPVYDLWVWRSLLISDTPPFNEMQIMHQLTFRI